MVLQWDVPECSLWIEGKILPTGHCLGVMLLNEEGTQRLSIVKLLL